MPERPVLSEETASRNQRPRSLDVSGWQIIVAENLGPAQRGLSREYALADEIGAGARAPTILIWRSQQALIVARSQTHWPGFAAAAATLAEVGWPVLVRRSGGGAFPIGPGTVQLAMMARYPNQGISMDRVYDRLGLLIGSALADFGIAARVGATPGAFCDGRNDLAVAGRKIAGLAQHWRPCGHAERCVIAGASVLVDTDVEELAAIVARFHALCGQTVDIRPQAMTTLRESRDPLTPPQRNLPVEFSAHLAATAERRIANND